MAIEILTVSLSDESVEKVAQRVAQLMKGGGDWHGYGQQGGNEAATQSNPPSPETRRTQSDQVSQQGAGTWGDQPVDDGGWPQGSTATPPQQQPQAQPQPGQQQGNVRYCQHGEMRLVPAGFSQSSGKAYKAFYACPTPRGAADKCKSITA